MTTDNWVSLCGFALAGSIAALGWFVNGWVNRKKDITLKRVEYRLRAFHDFLPILFVTGNPFDDPDFVRKLGDARMQFQLYGSKNEIEAMERFISAINDRDLDEANAALNALKPLVRSQIRRELEIRD